jgi:NADPH-dependent 2,4-dienoyl-CoA reductase/sulfur reductase-like enzyme
MRILIIGGVAAGTSAATKARRNNRDAEIVIYEKDDYISYAGCGMPYYIGGITKNISDVAPRDPAFFKNQHNIDVHILHEVLSINPEEKTVLVKNLSTDETFEDQYDKLVISTGARAVVPPIKGADRPHVFTLRNVNDMKRIKGFIDTSQPKQAVIVGTGFIGLEMCENLKALGIEVTMVERLPQITPGLDSDMAVHVEKHIKKKGVKVLTEASVVEITDKAVILSEGEELAADTVLLATGARPNTELASAAGIELGVAGAIRVNRSMQTNLADVYACGDCTEQFQLITGKTVYRPLGSTANKTGRICGDVLTGGSSEFRGVLGTAIFRIFDMAVAQTGLSEREAVEEGYDVVVSRDMKPDKPVIMGGKDMIIKGIADKKTGRLLGAQIVGYDGVDRRIDVFATALTFEAKAEDLPHLDLAYSPPFSTVRDPVIYTGMILENLINNSSL